MAPGRRRSPSRTSTYLASRKRASRSGSSGRVLRSCSSSMKLRAPASSSSSGVAWPVVGFLGVIALGGRRQEAGWEGCVAGAGHVNLQRDGAHLQGACVSAVAFIGGGAGQISLPFGLAEAVKDKAEQFAQAEVIESGGERLGKLGG